MNSPSKINIKNLEQRQLNKGIALILVVQYFNNSLPSLFVKERLPPVPRLCISGTFAAIATQASGN